MNGPGLEPSLEVAHKPHYKAALIVVSRAKGTRETTEGELFSGKLKVDNKSISDSRAIEIDSTLA